MKKNIIIIGGGGAALFSGATVLQMSKKYNVYMISDEELYCRCSSPYILNKRAELKNTIMPDEMITKFGIKLIKGKAININYEKKIVKFESEKEIKNIKFEKLIFATGAKPFIPEIPGNKLKNVFKIRTANDIKNIEQSIKKCKSVTIIGGGVIGVEIASALRQRKLKINMLIIEDKVFQRISDEEYSTLVNNHLKNNKINIINNAKINRIVGENKCESIIYDKDEKYHTLKTDIVIFATGVRANLELAKSINIKTNNFGIIVDDYMKTNLKNVYAVGDCCVAKSFISKKNEPSQLATNSVIQGKILGKNLAGIKTKYTGHTSATVLEFLNSEFGCAGYNEKQCKKAGIKYYTGISHSTDIYQDLKNARNIQVKLIFNKKTNKIIGVQSYGKNLIWIVNLISFAIIQNTSINDLINLDYASHPSVSPWPFMDPIVDACEHAMKNNK